MNKIFRNILAVCIIIIILGMGTFMGTTTSKDFEKDLTNLGNNSTNKSVTIELERPPFLDDLEGDAP